VSTALASAGFLASSGKPYDAKSISRMVDREGHMAKGRFVAYYRVSTEKQGRSGLGLEAPQEAVRDQTSSVGATIRTGVP
jgi:hypothetical protein